MDIKKLGYHAWEISTNGRMVAQVNMDYLDQVQKVLFSSRDSVERRVVKDLVLNHALNYVRDRRDLPCSSSDKLTQGDSAALMDFGMVTSDVVELPDAVVDMRLRGLVEILETISEGDDMGTLLMDVILFVKSRTGVDITLEPGKGDFLEPGIKIVTKNGRFRFWHNIGVGDLENGDKNHLLHIVPDYHPEAHQRKWKSATLINGDTDYNIRGKAVHRVYPPSGSTRNNKDYLFGHWSGVIHPYYAEGSDFEVSVSPIELQTQDGFDELVDFICAALETGGKYISISGGFRSPYTYPSNIGNQGFKVRGSEDKAYWQFETLLKEGKLGSAIIPPWFYNEDWPEAYELAKEEHRATDDEVFKDMFGKK